jgi:hypothetical protein
MRVVICCDSCLTTKAKSPCPPPHGLDLHDDELLVLDFAPIGEYALKRGGALSRPCK